MRGAEALLSGAGVFLIAAVALAPVAVAEANPSARAWSIESSPDPIGASSSGLDRELRRSGQLVAVGSGEYPSGRQLPDQLALIEQLADGAWTIASSPVLRHATASPLDGVSCVPGGFCVAVGYAQFADPAAFDPLAETRTATSWSVDPLPIPAGAQDPTLAAVSCAGSGDCVAVGRDINTRTDSTGPWLNS